jgi:glycolate oxidase FAD binding subunit
MADVIKPINAADVENAVRAALDAGKTIEIVGHGSKRALGRPLSTDLILDLSWLSGVTLYEPEELVLSAGAGTAIAEIEALLAGHGQQLAFEPMDFAPILGGTYGRGTIGGVVATNSSGPRRISAGAARDHVLGFSAVSGRGEAFKSGGRVVKNVTGYDLSKLMTGSLGTLAVMTTVTLKVLPKPEAEASVLMPALDMAGATKAISAAMASEAFVSGAAHIPAAPASRIEACRSAAGSASVTAFRVEGFAPSVAHRTALLQSLLGRWGESIVFDEQPSRELWRTVRDVAPLGASIAGADRPLWRLSTPPSCALDLATAIDTQAEAEMLIDWAGGLVWVMLEPSADAGAALVRGAVARGGGQAMLVRAPASVRAEIDVFQPQDTGLAALTDRVKNGFDPKGILNPGRIGIRRQKPEIRGESLPPGHLTSDI